MMPNDLFVYAARRVANKPLLTRVGHSAKFHSLRSAISSPGSGLSKSVGLATATGRAALGLITPVVPGLTSFVSLIAQCTEKWARKKLHATRLDNAMKEGNLEETVKFTLKDLSVEELDRYRWKVKEACDALSKCTKTLVSEREAGSECNYYLELAIKAEQATRRINKLRERCDHIYAVLVVTYDWLNKCQYGDSSSGAATGGVDGFKNQILARLQSQFDEAQAPQNQNEEYKQILNSDHYACKEWCWVKNVEKDDSKLVMDIRNHLAETGKWVSSPFTVQDTISIFSPSNIKTIKQDVLQGHL
jgi:hypothetical protein